MDSTLGPGSVIAGRYHLTAQLGQGGMGSVWRAEHLTLRSPVAVKLIDPAIAGRRETLERFQAEAQAAAALRSPHVVQILDYGIDDNLRSVPYIVMELLEGESLAARLERVGRLPPAETARFVTTMSHAPSPARRRARIVHRDLKPENVFLVRNDDQDLAKVLDFGIAKTATPRGPSGGAMSGKGPTRTGSILGTPGYMSPEQAQGTKTLDGRSDVWSLGVIVFECVVGQAPFESEALGDLLLRICMHPLPVPSQIAPVPPGFDAWFAHAVLPSRSSQRFQSAKELAEALRAVLLPDALAPGSGSSPSLVPLPPSAISPSGHDGGATPMSPAVTAATVALTPPQLEGATPMITVPSAAAGSENDGSPAPPRPARRCQGPVAGDGGGRRKAGDGGPYVAVAVGLVLLGAAGTWLAPSARAAQAREAASHRRSAGSATMAAPSPPIVAPSQAPGPSTPAGHDDSAGPLPRLRRPPSSPRAPASAANSEPSAGSSPKPRTTAHASRIRSPPPVAPPPPVPREPPSPPRPKPSDRLGF